jgi:ParB family chromosome partitioning protein
MNNADDKQRRLGKGLSALLPSKPQERFGTPGSPEGRLASDPTKLPIEVIEPNPEQPRGVFQQEPLDELAASIRTHGIIQPLVVRRVGQTFQIVAGERRWRAAKIAGLREVPVLVQKIDDYHLLEIALIENIQREDLNPIETATAFDRLAREFGLSQEEIGRRTGKDRVTISNLLRLLRLPQPVQELIAENRLSMGHAKAILGLHGADEQIGLAKKAVDQGLSVRQVEREAQESLRDFVEAPAMAKKKQEDPNVRAAVEAMESALGTRVRIVPTGEHKGRIEIDYYSVEELDRLYGLITEGKK